MKYNTYIEAIFLKRPNRFIAHCLLEDGKEVIAHVPNTGRCKELLISGVTVFLDYGPKKTRKTDYTLYMVKKEKRFINIDSQAPNKIVKEALKSGTIVPQAFRDKNFDISSEYTYGNSRFDFMLESKEEKMLIEVKGVTLEKSGVVGFPDAPSLRALKHTNQLISAKKKNIHGLIIFLVQMEDPIVKFLPNRAAQEELADVLLEAKKAGVRVVAYNCKINKNEISVNNLVEVDLISTGFIF